MKGWDRVQTLVSELDGYSDPKVQGNVRELVAALLALHGEALAELLEHLETDALSEIAREPKLSSVLLLHGLHPDGVQTRIERALEKVRPQLEAHRGDVEVLEVGETRLRLRLKGTCNGCPSSASTFRNLLENAVFELAPEIESIEVEGMVAPR